MIFSVSFLIVFLLIAIRNHDFLRLLTFQLIDQFVSILHIFLLLLLSGYLHELHSLKSQFGFFLTTIALLLARLLLHSRQFSF